MIAALQDAVRRLFHEEAARFGLDPAKLRVGYVLNPGGFVNQSFRVEAGERRLHLKLSAGREGQASLRRWHRLGDVLTARHRAPRILDWIEVGGAAGLLFEHTEGSPPPLSRALLAEMLPWHARLGADEELREGLSIAPAPTALEVYERGLLDRAREDLAGIGAAVPDFLEADVLSWMREETESLYARIAGASCFGEELGTPVHGDLWLQNVLVDARGEWAVLDWDELSIGDRVLDLATLIGPNLGDLRPLKLHEMVADGLSASERERLDWLGRATLLDWIIDPLADWVEAVVAPEHLARVRAQKERQHRDALELYGRLYGAGPRGRSAR